ncbi:MAG: hypothetical protein PVG90_07270 [Bacillota bacterium]|jgi:hypothetical protein
MMQKHYILLLSLLLVISGSCGCFGNLTVAGQPVRLQTTGGIIFVKSGGGNTRIWHRNLADGAETLLYDYGANITEPNPAVYPNQNTKIVFAGKESNTEDFNLYVYDLITGEKTDFDCNDDINDDRHCTFDQSGTKFVFQSNRNYPKKYKVFYCDSSNTVLKIDDEGGLVPALSPDGTKIAYIKKDATDEQYKLWVYDLNKTLTPNPKQITTANNVYHPAWASDNETLAVETYEISTGPRFIATIKPFAEAPQLQQAVYSWGKNDNYRHPAWGEAGGRAILFFTGKLLTSDRFALGAVYYDEVLEKGVNAQWYLVASDGGKHLKEPCWAPDLTVCTSE